MFRSRRAAATALALVLLVAARLPAQTLPPFVKDAPAVDKPVANACTCVVHPLGALADDPRFGKWVVETLPAMIQPNSWKVTERGSPLRCISYYAPSKALVVCQTPAVQAEIKAFLADMHKATAAAKQEPTTIGHAVPANFTETRPLEPLAGTRGGYPVPAPQQQPKHLFHLIVRYEGDGLDDATLAKLMTQLGSGEKSKEKDGDEKTESKGSTLSQLLHFIVRYEGDGIIDANVASLLRDVYGAQTGTPRTPVPANGGTFPMSAPSLEPPPPPAPSAVPPKASVVPSKASSKAGTDSNTWAR